MNDTQDDIGLLGAGVLKEVDAPYSYRSLESASHIRVVELLSKTQSSLNDLFCRIHHVDLNNPKLEYVAISYVWGDSSMALRKKIYVAGEGFVLITPNLYSCLSRLQHSEDSTLVWADGMTINQSSDEAALQERSGQVRLMRRIYSQARLVVVDLGDHAADDKVLLKGLNQLACVNEHEWRGVMEMAKGYIATSPHMLAKSFREKQMEYLELKEAIQSFDIPGQTHPFWRAFARLLKRPWFRRVWIIQEFSLNYKVTFLLTRSYMDVQTFSVAAERGLDHQQFVKSMLESYSTRFTRLRAQISVNLHLLLSAILYVLTGFRSPARQDTDWEGLYSNAFRDLLWTRCCVHLRAQLGEDWESWDPDGRNFNPKSLDLLMLFLHYREFNCTDQRDRIYGICGLADSESVADLAINYTESPADLSLRFSRHLVKQGFGRPLLYLASYGNGALPSWTISIDDDFLTRDFFAHLLPDLRGEKNWTLFRAAADTTFSCRLSAVNEDCLITRGIIVGSILTQTEPFAFTKKNWQLGNSVIPWFFARMMVWGVGASAWMHEVAEFLGEDLSRFRTACYRTTVAGLMDGEDGRPQRLGDDPESVSFRDSLELWFPDWTTPSGLLLRLVSRQRFQQANRAKVSGQFLMHVMANRRLGFITVTEIGIDDGPSGYICQLPEAAEVGDRVAVISGCPIPFVLRKEADSSAFRLIGCCYIDGIMDGEAFWGKRAREIVLV